MVGGVTPGKGGSSHLGLPVFNSVEEVCEIKQTILSFFHLTLSHSVKNFPFRQSKKLEQMHQ